MKRTLAALFLIFGFFEVTCLMAATYQPQKLGYVDIAISSAPVASITRSTASAVGTMRWCTDCITNGGVGTLCISTGTTAWNQFILSTGTVCK